MSRLSTLPRVYIGRLSHRARERDVERFFKGFGKIVEVDLKNGQLLLSSMHPDEANLSETR
ncbi:hypothetical protein AB205_0006680 [Aquarana catesbeiana]|uniref:RRM domain-containing protein n=1 Tax=Aquarana catesbeiana TaxID=8400 RepID=A0A2G9SGW1_AQUCT|nr:hypothetical protein AB205_0006680 [Aquarana catesbeiana]